MRVYHGEGRDLVRPAGKGAQRRADLHVATLVASAVVAAVVIVSVTSRSGQPQGVALLLAAPVKPQLDAACSACLSSILKDNQPWTADPSFDPKHAMLCVAASCKYATLKTVPDSGTMQLSALRAGNKAAGKTKMLAVLSKEQARLDKQQLVLNWNRARVFAQFMGPPGKSSKMVLANWVPPMDPQGRPVPSWLKFVPAGAPGTSGLFGTAGAWDPEKPPDLDPYCLTPWCAPIKRKPTSILTNNTNCFAHDTCNTCLTGGCAWCSGSEVCGTSCPALWNVQMFTKLESCPAPANLQAQEQQEDVRELRDLTVASSHSEVGQELVKNNTAEEKRDVKAENVVMDASKFEFFPMAKNPFLGDPGDPSVARTVQFKQKAAAANGGKISLAAALAPLNDEQGHINAKRQMLFFRTETGVQPGLEQSIYDPTVGGGGSWDNWAKPTTTWSLVGRPAPGWLHWGNDNDGGYFNPVGGSQWDPQMLDPAENKGTYGPATNEYRVQHPHPEDEEPAPLAVDSPLFGA